jgi:hypothetical protein
MIFAASSSASFASIYSITVGVLAQPLTRPNHTPQAVSLQQPFSLHPNALLLRASRSLQPILLLNAFSNHLTAKLPTTTQAPSSSPVALAPMTLVVLVLSWSVALTWALHLSTYSSSHQTFSPMCPAISCQRESTHAMNPVPLE